ncbi:MAG: PKD domain-containing protein, partial [Ferruginibacter sp.]
MKTSFATRAYCLLLFMLVGIIGKAQLTANFSASPTVGCAPLLVNFADQTAGNPTEWKWDLGDGTISFLQNPSVSYFNPGFYTVKLVAKNAAGADSVVKTQYINVSVQPTVQFTASVNSGCFPLPVQFTDQSTGGGDSIETWQWDFGDGFSSGEQSPLHIYNNSGNFNVTLRIINKKGCLNTFSKDQYIRIDAGVTANFSSIVPSLCSAPVTINFQNLSIGTGTLAYQWLFGDGAASSLPNPSHIYNSAGTYTVKLIVTNATGCKDTLSKPNAFVVGNVSAAFIANDIICAGAPQFITNTSSPLPSSATWYFGDGTSSNKINPVKQYSNPGVYQIKMIANFGSCLDSAFKTVTVIPKPAAAFSSDDSANCKYPFTVNFTDQSLNAVSYQWDFGDNTNSTLPNPSHIYNNFGNFNVQLVITSTNGCTDTLKKTNYIHIIKPNVVFNNLPDSGCVPFTKYFASTTTSLSPVITYLWDFGDGSTSVNPTPTHSYSSPGIYAVNVIITTAGGCADTATLARGIIATSRPVAVFSATPRNTCARTSINFIDESTGNVSKWLWDFGDGSTSATQNPRHTYFDTGYFNVQLIVWNTGCPDTVNYGDYIHINPPIARFIESFDCNRPLERVFTNQSKGADEWAWDFGDGNTSTLFSPEHAYSQPGTYIVSLFVRNRTSGCDFTTVKTIQVVNANASFFASDTIICKGSNIIFTNNDSITTVKAFEWNFGDGTTSNSTTTNTATHLYTASGNYTVRLIITDILGCKDTMTKTSYIRIDGPTAKFVPSVPGSCLNNMVTFNDASAGDNEHPIQTWSWNYGDGNTEILSTPPFQHNYTTPGAYMVILKVTDSKGCADSIKIATALIISKPEAKFTTPDTVTCPSKQVVFTNQSAGPGLSWLWNFGDGKTSVAQNPAHNYLTDGIYSVKLFIRDQYGCMDSVTRPALISIITPVANFTMSDSFSICPPLIVQFNNQSVQTIKQNWDFGDGTSASIFNPSHFYNYPGTYTVTLTVTGEGGCTDTMKHNIVLRGPRGTFIYDPATGCDPLKSNFIASTRDRISFIWDFNDGTTVSTTDSVISHNYTNPGMFLPKMILVDANGCQVPITGKDTIIVNGVTAKFNFLEMLICDRGNVSFLNSTVSNDIITGYNWSLGDGGTSTLQNPQHMYTATGIYYPGLIVHTLNGCVDSFVSPIPVKVVASPQINITSTQNGCTPLAVTFHGIVAVPDTSRLTWTWIFGNGDASSIQNPAIQNYNVAGVYNPAVVVTNSSGCKDTANKIIEAYIIPAVNAGRDTTICHRIGVTLQATGTANYKWSPSAGLSCTNCANPVATPDSARKYIVKGTSLEGCSAVDSLLVKVQYPFKIKYSATDTLCKGQTLRLLATGTDRFQWSPSTGLNNSNIASPVGNPDTTITYRVVGTDNLGCFSDTGYVFVKVFPIPAVNAGDDKTINIGKSIDLVPAISSDVSEVIWSPTGSIFRNTYPAISVKPNQTTEYTAEVKNKGGCMARDKATVYVICNGVNVYIPNTFSPNGDGANDNFYPRGTGLFKIKTLRIFNRWGEIVFEKSSFNANDPAFGWDGTYKGVKLSADVFVYMI